MGSKTPHTKLTDRLGKAVGNHGLSTVKKLNIPASRERGLKGVGPEIQAFLGQEMPQASQRVAGGKRMK